MNRQNIIQALINKINAKSYLEIGLGVGHVFRGIKCDKKYGVDPQFNNYVYERGTKCDIEPTHKMTSDEFFEQNLEKFDVIFIDGMHEATYTERDINNAVKCLSDGGYIVCHDMSPMNEKHQIVPRVHDIWNGDCWKAWVKIRASNPNLNMYVIDHDHGCGVIQKGSQEENHWKDNQNNNCCMHSRSNQEFSRYIQDTFRH